MHKILLLSLICTYLVVCGVFKMKFVKQKVPKALILFAHSLLKYPVTFFLAKKRRHFDRRIIVVVVLYSISTYIFLLSAEHISVVTLAICTPTRIIFTFILSKFFYAKKYTFLQHLALVMIIIGFSIANLRNNTSEKVTNVKYLLFLLFGNFCNSVSCIFFDRTIKQKNMNYWEYMYTYTFLNLLISTMELMLEYSFSSYDFAPYLRNKEFYLNVLAQTAETFLIAYISFQLTPLQRGLNHIVCAVTITILTNVLFETSPSAHSVLACILTYVGLIMFELKSLKKIIKKQSREVS